MSDASLLRCGLLAIASLASAAEVPSMPVRPPHLVVIFSDQQHAWAQGRRDPSFRTPVQDAFAREACDFTQAYASCPLCSPSRATLLTGLLPDRSGVLNNGVPLTHPTIAPELQRAGYRTAYFGKWHLRAEAVATAGWDAQAGVCDEYVKPNRPLSDDETRDAALAFIKGCDPERPTAIFVSFDQPHDIYRASPASPYPPSSTPDPVPGPDLPLPPGLGQERATIAVDWPEYLKPKTNRAAQEAFASDPAAWQRYRAIYRQCNEGYDRNLGRVIDALKARGLWDDAVVVVTSDHGDMDGHHNLAFKGPAPYQQLQRIPLAIRVPAGRGGAIGRRDDLVANADIPATLLDYAGIASASDGISLRPALEGRTAHARETVVVRYPVPVMHTLRHGSWTYTRCADGRQWLYDLASDPDELRDRCGDAPDALTTMSARLDAWLASRPR
jgi:arylsulfatase A-like enzyme